MNHGAEIRWHEQGFHICCEGHGFTVSGAGFTVWDEKLPDAIEAARLLRLPPSYRRPAGPTRPDSAAPAC